MERSVRALDEHGAKTGALGAVVIACLALLLLVNVVMLARSVDLLRFPGEVTEVDIARRGAFALADYYAQLAKQKGLDRNRAVRESLAKFKFEIEQSLTSDDVGFVLGLYGRNVQDVLSREEENLRREVVGRIVSLDPRLSTMRGRATVIVEVVGGSVRIKDSQGVLSSETRAQLVSDPDVQSLTDLVQVEIADGKVTLVTARTLQAQVESLRSEADRQRSSLLDLQRVSGMAELPGPGILIRLSKARNKDLDWDPYYDIRDLINELFAAGAAGVEVGGQRIIATSSIRMVGDQILVNQQPISLNPLIVKAVGDPQVLESGLDILRNTVGFFTSELTIERRNTVALSAYPVPR